MALAKVSTCLFAGVVGSAALVGIATPSSAFTLAAPTLARTVENRGIEHVWWDQWGRWHPNHRHWGSRHWGWGPPPPPAYDFYAPPAPPAFGVYVSPPPVYEYYGPRERWSDEE